MTSTNKTIHKVSAIDEPWFWEGNVQQCLVDYLEEHGNKILQSVSTKSRQQGVDVIAKTPDGKRLLVTVKGYPKGTKKTRSGTQARHWFSHAIFDLVLYRQEEPTAELGICLPAGYSTYTNLATRVDWLKVNLPFDFFWVYDNGEVERD